MAQDKKGFLMYADWQATVKHLSDEQAGQLLKHLLSYVNDENPVCDNPIINICFEPIKQQLKRDLDKWQESKGNKSKNGALGNLKRWNVDLYNEVVTDKMSIEDAVNIAKSRKAIPSDRNLSQRVANIAVNDNVNVSVNVNDNVNDIKENNTTTSNEVEAEESFDFKKLKAWFNNLEGLPKVRSISESRKKGIKSLIKNHGFNKSDITEGFKLASNSDFLKGDNDREFKADFDWLINPTNLTKVLENKYCNKEKSSAKKESTGPKLNFIQS